MEPFVLANERVHLSIPTAADVERVTGLCQGQDIAEWTVVPSPYSREDGATYIEQVVPTGWRDDRAYTWAIRRPGPSMARSSGWSGSRWTPRRP
ncbi:hypothetical protein NKG05_29375 [Oerskovia sp. M15]